MSGTEFTAKKLKQLQLTLIYLLQSVNFQLGTVFPANLSFFNICLVVLFGMTCSYKFHSVVSLQCLYIFSPSRYLQHRQQEEVAWGSDIVRQIENH
jgi:hypothetical protein